MFWIVRFSSALSFLALLNRMFSLLCCVALCCVELSCVVLYCVVLFCCIVVEFIIFWTIPRCLSLPFLFLFLHPSIDSLRRFYFIKAIPVFALRVYILILLPLLFASSLESMISSWLGY